MLEQMHASIGPTVPSPCPTKEVIGCTESVIDRVQADVLGTFVNLQAEKPKPSNALLSSLGSRRACGAWAIQNHCSY
jgi:hypothetical protein